MKRARSTKHVTPASTRVTHSATPKHVVDPILNHERRREELEAAQSKVLPALGLDVGTSFIGVALAVAPIPQPLTVIAADDQAISYVGTLVDDYQLKTIVVGISENRSAQVAMAFARQLKAAYGPKVRVVLSDETLSTQVARQRLASAGKKLKPKERLDQYAAAYILEEWLEEQ